MVKLLMHDLIKIALFCTHTDDSESDQTAIILTVYFVLIVLTCTCNLVVCNIIIKRRKKKKRKKKKYVFSHENVQCDSSSIVESTYLDQLQDINLNQLQNINLDQLQNNEMSEPTMWYNSCDNVDETDRDSRLIPSPQYFSSPSIDPYNTTEYIPTCYSQVASLLECTHDGHSYSDPTNDFRLEIPKGAIPKQTKLSIDIGVALYGPFQYPEGFRPVSPVFWICIRDQNLSHFSEPVTVTIPHFLNLKCPEDISSLGLTFLKAEHEMNSHQMYQFHPAEGNMNFELHRKHGELQTTHFCSLCIASKDTMDAIKKANFCISAVVPRKFPVDQSAHAYFFLTFLLETCLTTLKDQISAILERESGFEERRQDFQFRDDDDQALAILLPDSIEDIWSFGLQFRHKVHSHTCMYIVGN